MNKPTITVLLAALFSSAHAQDSTLPPVPAAVVEEEAMPPVVLAGSEAEAEMPEVSMSAPLPPQEESIELELVTRGIYQCMDGGRAVFVDEEKRGQYRQCTQIRAPHYEQVQSNNGNAAGYDGNSPCSGAVVYEGSTYVFNDKEPCPIPASVFQSRKPIEANPEYYTQPQP